MYWHIVHAENSIYINKCTTRFFHLAAKVRGSKNRIDKVEFKGNSLEDQSHIKAASVEFFSVIFQQSPVQLDPLLFQVNRGRVSLAKNTMLHAIPSNEKN